MEGEEIIRESVAVVKKAITRGSDETPAEKFERLFIFHLDWVRDETGGYFDFLNQLKTLGPAAALKIENLFEGIFRQKKKYLENPTQNEALETLYSIQNWTMEVLNNYVRTKNIY